MQFPLINKGEGKCDSLDRQGEGCAKNTVMDVNDRARLA